MGVIFSLLFSTPLPVWTPLYTGETENDLLIMTWYVYRDVFYCVICKCNLLTTTANCLIIIWHVTSAPCSIIFLKLEEGSFIETSQIEERTISNQTVQHFCFLIHKSSSFDQYAIPAVQCFYVHIYSIPQV